MLSLRSLSFLNKPPVSPPPTSFSSKTNALTISQSLVHTDDASRKTRAKKPSSFLSCVVHATEKDSHKFDVDPDKAREALQELDQQLQSLAQKQISTPKKRASDVDLTKDRMTEEEFSESFLKYSVVALVLFSIFYNILFETVIKPAIDVPLPVPATTAVTEASQDQTSN
ncbi:uncharacterized protein LOC132164278 [Corylus avellana]|uniref:uncharacterized protein LOC132164278 n=1 Tax=Corylus avellana TaxID=13451 RepID=UPI00286AFC4A|nr:uncharacterized protein LOC132164278 [Corylus avellana]